MYDLDMAEHRVTYRLDSSNRWVATAAGRRRVRGSGKTLRLARKELRISLAPHVDDPYRIDLVEDVRLPPPARGLLVQHWKARRKADQEAKRASQATLAALQALVQLKISLKDAADLLGIPAARLQQMRAGKGR
jgi:hypothetical protein